MARGEILDLEALADVYPEILDGLRVPTQLDPDTVKDAILLDTLEQSVLYTDPEFLAQAIEIWSKRRLYSWQRMADALYKNYDPFINFTRDERRENTETRNLAGLETRNLAGTETRDLDGNSKRATAAYNENTVGDYTPREKVDTEDNGTIDTTDTGTVNRTDTGTVTHVETFHSQGDSALYTPTDVAGKEAKLRLDYDIISIIIREFKNRFIVQTY